MQFVSSEPVQRIRRAFTDHLPAMDNHISKAVPEFSNEGLFLLGYQCRHHYDALALPLVIGLLRKHSSSDLKAMAESFAFENCEVVRDRHSTLVRHARGT